MSKDPENNRKIKRKIIIILPGNIMIPGRYDIFPLEAIMKEKNRFSKLKKLMGKLALPLFFVVLVFLDIVFRYFYQSLETIEIESTAAMIFTLGWSLVLTGIAWVMPVKVRKIFMPVIVIFNVLVCLTHAVMHHLFGNFFAVSDLYYAGDGAKFFSFAYLVIRKGLLVFCAAAVIGIILVSVWHGKFEAKKWSVRQLVLGLLAVAVGLGCVGIQHRDYMGEINETMTWEDNGSVSDADIYKEMSDVNRSLYLCGIYQYLWRSFSVTTGLGDSFQNAETYRELDEYMASTPKAEHLPNAWSGTLKGDNCFFVLLESIDTWMLTEEYMPNLYALQQKSVDFTEHFSTLYISAATFNTEFIANTGQVPPSAGLDTKSYQNSDFPTSLAKLFTAAGYKARSFHSSNPTIYNRGKIHLNLGYESYSSWTDMGMDNYQLDSQLTSGFAKMTEGDPFFSFILTYSGHGPYNDEMAVISDPHLETAKAAIAESDVLPEALADPEYTLAVAHAMETDEFIGNLLAELDASGLSENTALVFFTDHYSKYMTDTELVMKLKGAANMDLICRTPFFIYSPRFEAQKVTRITSTADIAPTVANLFGLDVNYAWYPGCDALGNNETFDSYGHADIPCGAAVFRSGAYYDGIYHSIPSADSIRWLDIAWKLMKCNYFAHLE